MIQVNNVTKKFGSFTALNNMSCKISDGCIYGLIGSNGAGKSTFLRLITGVYKPDEGQVLLDGEPVYENPAAKAKIAYVPDELFFLPGSSLNRMAKLYAAVFPDFSFERFQELVKLFGLSPKAPVNTFSKGMRRQGATLLALACRPKYIFFDETFDGLDPVMRNVVKQLITTDVLERQATAIITSHSLRELEDTCDQLSLLHKGGIIFESDIQDLKTTLFKLQVGFNKPFSREMFSALDILSYSARGSVATFIVRGDREKTVELIRAHSPVLLDVLPLTLEEVFIYEMEALGYCFKDMIS
jgi:hypothetical protein